MNSETDKILESLLKQQGISEFLPFKKPDLCKIEVPLYGYCKNDKFYICDASLKEYELHKVFASNNGTFLIGKNDERFFLTHFSTDDCIIISNDNRIIVKNLDCYTYVNRISQHDPNMIILQNKLANENNRCPYETEPGVKMAKVAIVEDNIVYYLQVNEDMFDFKQWKKSAVDIKQMTANNFRELRNDPMMQSEFRLFTSEGMGYHYRYYGNKSKDFFDVIFTAEELRTYMR